MDDLDKAATIWLTVSIHFCFGVNLDFTPDLYLKVSIYENLRIYTVNMLQMHCKYLKKITQASTANCLT